MTNHFDLNFHWQLRFEKPIKKIVGPLLLQPATLELDLKAATDMLILHARDKRIACRVRRPGYDAPYRWQFTMRSKVPSGARTELQKIIDGEGDWMFYGHAAQCADPRLTDWYVIDLNAFRAHLVRHPAYRPKQIPNGDGTKFVPFDIRDFSPKLLVATNVQREAAQPL